MSRLLIPLNTTATSSLQVQIRSAILQGIADGILPPRGRLPSSRKLAAELGVSRNTVTLALQQLLAEGHLVSRARSGLFVAEALGPADLSPGHFRVAPAPDRGQWARRFRAPPAQVGFRVPPNWQSYPHPFIDGPFDSTIFPLAEWREVMRTVLGRREVQQWTASTDETDDPALLEQIRTRILPRRGMRAGADEILVTHGAPHGLSLVCALLLAPGITIAREQPGDPALAALATLHGARLHLQPVDQDGMVIDSGLAKCQLVHVTPACQMPTGVRLSADRRRALLAAAAANDAVLIEQDVEDPAAYQDRAIPSLHSLAGGARVIHIAELARILSPGLRLGFIVAPPEVIAALRALRRLSLRGVSLMGQRGVALFLALGHYDAAMTRLGRIIKARRIALRDALNHHLPHAITTGPVRHGSTVWVQAHGNADADALAARAAASGILIEPAAHYFADALESAGCFRLGVTCVQEHRIRPGVAALADLLHDMSGVPAPENLARAAGRHLTGAALRTAMSGARLLYRTVYGDPCTIELMPDGRMLGIAGYANEDRDEGRWWVDGNRWCRQWKRWAYGETAVFETTVDDGRVAWYRDGRLVDWAIYGQVT
jgi:GntR family transcriptional regulator/MocR family aminotransferase